MQDQQLRSSSNEQFSRKSHETALWNRIKNQFTSKSQDKEQLTRSPRSTVPRICVANAPDMDCRTEIPANGHSKRQRGQLDHSYLSPVRAPASPRLSKSEQMLSRLLKDQLQLAYVDHQNNVRCAQSHAALEHLRISQPRLELTPSSSRHASPSRVTKSQNHSPSMSRRATGRSEYAGSSGSEKSYSSNKSAPPAYSQLGRSKSCTPSRTQSPAHQGLSRCSSNTNCPRHSPLRTTQSLHHHPSNSKSRTGSTSSLVKNAQINLLWAFILDAIRTGQLEDYDESDPKQWWRKLFQTLKLMHGKAKASSIAGQLMGNPLVLEAIQNKLAGMVGGQSGYVQSLPKAVQRRIKALKKLQFECTKLEAEFYEEVHKLECRFADRYSPVFAKRKKIVSGEHEPNDEECDWPSDEEEEDEDEEGHIPQKQIEPAEDEAETKGIASFWSTTIKNADVLANMIQEHDEPILDSLSDIKVAFASEPMGFSLQFEFDDNEYFTDKVLTKHYEMRSSPDENDPFGFEGPEIVACKGCKIHWKEGKNVTVTSMKKKQKNAKTGSTRMVTKSVQTDSFFNFFSPPDISGLDKDEEVDDDTEALLQSDFHIGHFIRERVVPHAVLYFTGEAEDDDEDDDDDDMEDDDDYDEEDDPDYDPSKDPSALKGKDCKQQ